MVVSLTKELFQIVVLSLYVNITSILIFINPAGIIRWGILIPNTL